MKAFEYEEARDKLSTVLDTALIEDVIIRNGKGESFKISSLNSNTSGKSPLEGIKGIKVNITTQELVEMIREGRAGE
ncbi:hypothetical protein AGMMS49942_17740 [Spirochaetia bacterium]|nr:hypothetical protein AGMMS49942_17740 [Spirochaetia bacterium]